MSLALGNHIPWTEARDGSLLEAALEAGALCLVTLAPNLELVVWGIFVRQLVESPLWEQNVQGVRVSRPLHSS